MKRRVIDILLILILLGGCFVFARTQSEYQELRAEYARVVSAVGELSISDPTQLHAVAIDTHDPWHWGWHIYTPDNSNSTLTFMAGGGGGSSGSVPNQHHNMTHIAVRRPSGGRVTLVVREFFGTSVLDFGTPDFFEFLEANRQRLVIEQWGSDSMAILKPGSPPVTFLKISMPDDLASEALSRFSDRGNRRFIPVLFEAKLELK